MALAFAQAVENDAATHKLAASMGLDPAEQATAGKMAGDLYKNAYGDSMEQVNETIGAVASTLADLSTNGGADVERLTKKALDLSATFPEMGDAVGSAGILMQTGLAKNADEAFDLIAGSAQKMPAAMRGELLPVMDEYSKHFEALGIDGTTAFGIMAEASKGGAIQMDKTGDALKEFTIRATDGSKATSDAYKSIGLDAEEMARKIAAGGPSAQEAFAKTVAGLQGIKDPAAQAQAAIGLFGTPLEDLGTNKIPEFLGAIDPAGDSFDSLAGKADEMGKTLNSGPGPALETLKRTAMDSFTQIMAAALPVLQPIIDTLMQYAPVIGPIAVGVGALAAVVWLVNGAMAAWNAIVAVGTGAQWLWNAAMAANPIGLVIAAIALLVAGVILAYNNVGWFKDAVDTAGRIAGEVFQNIVKWVQDCITWLDNALAPVGGIKGALAIRDRMGSGRGWLVQFPVRRQRQSGQRGRGRRRFRRLRPCPGIRAHHRRSAGPGRHVRRHRHRSGAGPGRRLRCQLRRGIGQHRRRRRAQHRRRRHDGINKAGSQGRRDHG
jgi:phage-related minor tail protein